MAKWRCLGHPSGNVPGQVDTQAWNSRSGVTVVNVGLLGLDKVMEKVRKRLWQGTVPRKGVE